MLCLKSTHAYFKISTSTIGRLRRRCWIIHEALSQKPYFKADVECIYIAILIKMITLSFAAIWVRCAGLFGSFTSRRSVTGL